MTLACTLYFHSPCFDGIASAVLAKAWWLVTQGSSTFNYVPVGYRRKAEWRSSVLPPNSLVVDFLFHEGAAFWADHHASTFGDAPSCPVPHADTRPNTRLFDSTAPSCAGLIWNLLRPIAPSSDARRLAELARWADRIDGARYTSIRQLQEARAPGLQLDLTLQGQWDNDYSVRLVEMLSSRTLAEVVRDPVTSERVREARAAQAVGLQRMRAAIRLHSGVAMYDLDATLGPIPRYGPYMIEPHAMGSIGLHRRVGGCSLLVMANPWRPEPHTHVGMVCAQFGGGGHRRVGAVAFGPGEETRVRAAVRALTRALGDREWTASSTSMTSSST